MYEDVENLRNPATVPPPAVEHTDRQPNLFTGWFEESEDYRVFRRDGTETYLLFYTVSGAGFFRGQDGTLTQARPRALHLYQSDVWNDYGTWPGQRWGFHWVHFRPRPTWSEWLRFSPAPGIAGLVQTQIQSEEIHRRVLETLAQTHRDSAIDTLWREELAMNSIERLLLMAGEVSFERGRPLDPRIHATLERIGTDLAADHSVDRLARAVNLSPSRFAHLFKTETGQTPQRYVSDVRIRQSLKLVELTHLPIAAVAESVGYHSAFHFSAAFRTKMGMSPRAYRTRHTKAV